MFTISCNSDNDDDDDSGGVKIDEDDEATTTFRLCTLSSTAMTSVEDDDNIGTSNCDQEASIRLIIDNRKNRTSYQAFCKLY
jgi:hypothetical protein